MSGLTWLHDIECRTEAATPGPWRLWEFSEHNEFLGRSQTGLGIATRENAGEDGFEIVCSIGIDPTERDVSNAEWIAHARSDVPRLCRAVRELYEHLAEALPYLEAYGTPGSDHLAAEVRRALERWQHGGNLILPDRHGISSEGR